MKKTIKRLSGVILTAIFASMVYSETVIAAGSVSISASAESVEVGGEVEVTIKAENPAGSAEKPEISVEYDAAVLTFDSCDKETGGGGGGLITLADTEATLKFKGTASGTTDVKVSAVLDGDGANVPSDQVTIAVGDGVGVPGAADGTDGATTSNIADGLISVSGTEKMISTTFPNEIMPVGFHKADFTYQEQLLESAQFDMGNLTLLYLTDASGQNGEFSIYDQTTDTFTDFVSINGIESKFIVIMNPDESVVVPSGFIKATLQWNGKTLTAYAIEGASAGTTEAPADTEGTMDTSANGVSTSDFFLLYALSSEGNQGWYMYDMKEGTYQRYLEFENTADVEPSVLDVFDSDTDSYKKQSHNRLIVICVLAGVLLAAVIVLIVLFVKLREFQGYEYIDEDEDDEDDEDEEERDSRRAGSSRSNARHTRAPEPLSQDEIRARRYEAGEDLEETGEINLEPASKRVEPAYKPTAPVSPVGYETQDMVFEDISLPQNLPDEEDEDEEEEEDDRRSRKKNKKEKKKSRFAKWYEDDDFGDEDDEDEDDEDDEDDDDEDDYTERHSLFGRKKKKVPEPAEAKQLDWGEMQNAMQGADEDERRPMSGTRRPVSSPKMIVTEPPVPAQVRPAKLTGDAKPRMEDPEPEERVEPPKPVRPKYEQPVAKKIPEPLQPRYEQPVEQPHYEQPVQQRYEQPVQQPHYEQPVQQPRYEQPMQQYAQQTYYQQPAEQYYDPQMQQQYYGQQMQGQQMQQQYYSQQMQGQQMQQQYYDPSMLQPQQPVQQSGYYEQPVPQQPQRQPQQPVQPRRQEPKLDLDDDFEFEFIDVN